MRKGPNPKIFLALTLVATVSGAGISYMQYTALDEQSAKVEGLRRDIRDERETQEQLDKAIAKLEECRVNLNHLEKGVPDFAYVPTMLAELENIGKAHGIEVTGVRPMVQQAKGRSASSSGRNEQVEARKPYREIDIEVRGVGGYGDVMRFVQSLQKFPKIVALRTVTMTPKSIIGQPDSNKLDCTLVLRSYVFQAVEPAATSVEEGRIDDQPDISKTPAAEPTEAKSDVPKVKNGQ